MEALSVVSSAFISFCQQEEEERHGCLGLNSQEPPGLLHSPTLPGEVGDSAQHLVRGPGGVAYGTAGQPASQTGRQEDSDTSFLLGMWRVCVAGVCGHIDVILSLGEKSCDPQQISSSDKRQWICV